MRRPHPYFVGSVLNDEVNLSTELVTTYLDNDASVWKAGSPQGSGQPELDFLSGGSNGTA
jgi:hypothetical protein